MYVHFYVILRTFNPKILFFMRRIEYIAPVESMRGNLSGKQDLVYPENNNPAWLTPDDGIKYARNYTTRYIGGKRSATGRNYFSVKRRHGVNLTIGSRLQQAILGAVGAIYGAIIVDAAVLQTIAAAWAFEKEHFSTMRKFIAHYLMLGLQRKQATITIGRPNNSNSFTVKNPWVAGGQGVDVISRPNFKHEIVFKFWRELSNATFFYILDKQYGAMPANLASMGTWDQLVETTYQGVSSFFAEQFGLEEGDEMFGYNPLMANGLFVVRADNGEYVSYTANIDPEIEYRTTAVPPTA